MGDAFLFTSHLLAYYYERSQWVSWNFNISHYKNFTYKNLTHTPPNTNPVPPCSLNLKLHNKFVYIPPFKLERQLLQLIRDNISEYNYTQFIRWETKPNGETIFMIPGGSFQPILPYRHKRSNFHYMGIGTLTLQWREWVRILPQWYVITIRHGPLGQLKKDIHCILDDIHFSYLVYEPNMFLPELFRTKHSFIAYDRGNSYCERKNTARIDIINRKYQNHMENQFCFQYYFNTSRCEKRNELPHCRYATGPLSLSIKRLGVIPDLREDAPTIAYGDLCFLHGNHTTNATNTISRTTHDGGVFIVLSLILGSLITISLAGTFHNHLRRFSDEVNGQLKDLQKDFTEQLNTKEDQAREINKKELQLTQVINHLAEITAHLASKQEDFQNLQFAVNRQLLEQQIAKW